MSLAAENGGTHKAELFGPGSDRNMLEKHKEEKIHLRRQLKLYHGISIVCGLIIGSSIFVSPKGVIKGTKSPALCLLVWGLCGGLATLGGLCCAELGATFPGSGEKYYYLKIMFGEFPAFLYMWIYMSFFRPGANAVKCLAFGQYILEPFFSDCDISGPTVVLLALLLCWLLIFINCVNVKLTAGAQTVLCSISQVALVIISVLGLVHIGSGNTDHLSQGFKGSSTDFADIILAAYSGIYAYGGWYAVNFVTEELENPKRNLPLSIYISMALVTLLYMLTNLAYLGVLGMDEVVNSKAVAVSFAQRTMGPISWIIPVFVSITLASSFNSGTLTASRVAFVAARQGHLPDVFSLISVKFLSPVTSLILVGCLISLFSILFDILFIINNLAFVMTLFDGISVAGLLYMRWKRPDIPRPVKLPVIIPISYLLIVFMLCTVTVVTRPTEVAMGFMFSLVTGILAYFVCKWRSKPAIFKRWMAEFTKLVQKVLISIPQEGEPEF